ncbi:MAG: hypothetical protein JO104_04800 [Candidatus Eremiobacteraeota bacterium]|nr:hypothetical protein [Candidatus Eremiobacteraeota bacterium]
MPTLDRLACSLLDDVAATFGLNDSELADLFGVRRPSLAAWREHGLPQGRRATAERLHDLARVFRREIIASRIPEIVRTPEEWLDGHTILETIRSNGTEPVYGYLRRLFSYV